MKKHLLFIISCCIILVVVPLLVNAQGEIVELPNPLQWETFGDVINGLIDIIKVLVIPIGTIMIIIGGFQYLTSAGNEDRIRKAKNTLLYAIIGIAVVLAVDFIVEAIREILGQL